MHNQFHFLTFPMSLATSALWDFTISGKRHKDTHPSRSSQPEPGVPQWHFSQSSGLSSKRVVPQEPEVSSPSRKPFTKLSLFRTAWTVSRKVPIPLPWIKRPCKMSLLRHSTKYVSTKSPTSAGWNPWRSSVPLIKIFTCSSLQSFFILPLIKWKVLVKSLPSS